MPRFYYSEIFFTSPWQFGLLGNGLCCFAQRMSKRTNECKRYINTSSLPEHCTKDQKKNKNQVLPLPKVLIMSLESRTQCPNEFISKGSNLLYNIGMVPLPTNPQQNSQKNLHIWKAYLYLHISIWHEGVK